MSERSLVISCDIDTAECKIDVPEVVTGAELKAAMAQVMASCVLTMARVAEAAKCSPEWTMKQLMRKFLSAVESSPEARGRILIRGDLP